MSVTKELMDMCNKIVGQWYCEELKQHFIFSLNDKLLKESKLIVINDKTFETVYGIAVHLSLEVSIETRFYFDVGMYNKRYYEIITLTRDLLMIREFWMIPDTPPSKKILTYKRSLDINAADDILKGLDLI